MLTKVKILMWFIFWTVITIVMSCAIFFAYTDAITYTFILKNTSVLKLKDFKIQIGCDNLDFDRRTVNKELKINSTDNIWNYAGVECNDIVNQTAHVSYIEIKNQRYVLEVVALTGKVYLSKKQSLVYFFNKTQWYNMVWVLLVSVFGMIFTCPWIDWEQEIKDY
jgi:hypothetical protein